MKCIDELACSHFRLARLAASMAQPRKLFSFLCLDPCLSWPFQGLGELSRTRIELISSFALAVCRRHQT